MKKLILASSSPRRKEILKKLKFDFDVLSSSVDERYKLNLSPKEIVKELSERKAKAISKKLPNSFVIGADTIVVIKNKILSKPNDKKDAFEMLNLLSNNYHYVLTGVCLITKKNNVIFNFVQITKVYFYKLEEELINRYIKTKSPYDKAGSYGIQDFSACFVKKIDGCFYNVVGFPISKFINTLKTFPEISSLFLKF